MPLLNMKMNETIEIERFYLSRNIDFHYVITEDLQDYAVLLTAKIWSL